MSSRTRTICVPSIWPIVRALVVVGEDEAVVLAVLGVAVGAVLADPDPVAEAVPAHHPGDAGRGAGGRRAAGSEDERRSRAVRRVAHLSVNRFALRESRPALGWNQANREEVRHGDADGQGGRSQASRRGRVDRDRRVGRGEEPLRRDRRRAGRPRRRGAGRPGRSRPPTRPSRPADFPQHERAARARPRRRAGRASAATTWR